MKSYRARASLLVAVVFAAAWMIPHFTDTAPRCAEWQEAVGRIALRTYGSVRQTFLLRAAVIAGEERPSNCANDWISLVYAEGNSEPRSSDFPPGTKLPGGGSLGEVQPGSRGTANTKP